MSSRASASMASDFPGYADVSGFLVIESRKISRKMATHNTEKRGREMNGVEIAIWAVVAFTLVYEPVFGYLDYRRFKRKAGTDDGARIRLYVRTMIGLWLPVLYILGVVGLTDVTLADIGFALPGFDTGPLGPPATYAVTALVYEPVFGYLDYRRFKRKAGTDDGARIRLYVRTMIGLWLPVLYILGVVGLTDVTLADIGFALPGFDTGPLGPPATYAVTALV